MPDFPTVVKHHQQVAHAHIDLGISLLRRSGSLKEAENHQRQAFTIFEKNQADFPNAPKDLYGPRRAQRWLGEVLLRTDRFEEAEKEVRAAMAREENLIAADSEHSAPPGLHNIKALLAATLLARGKSAEAEKLCREAVELREGQLVNFPKSSEGHRRLRSDCDLWFRSLTALGRLQEAEAVLRRAIESQEKTGELPGGTDPKIWGWLWYSLGLLLHETGRYEEAADAFRKSHHQFEDLAAKSPGAIQNIIAWILVDTPAIQFRDPKRAIRILKKILQDDPLWGRCWATLAIAHFELGQWDDALEAMQKSLEANKKETQLDQFFMAMMHWQCGNKHEARKWYDKALRALEPDLRDPLALRRRRAEAES